MNPTHTYAYNGNYYVTLLAIDTIMQIADTASANIICSGGPVNNCNFTAELIQKGAAIICPTDSFKLSVGPGTNLSYSWFFNGITITGAHDSIYYGQSQGFYMAVISNSTCSKSTNYYALANYPTYIPVIISYGVLTPCSNDSVKLSTGPNYNSYLWNNGATTNEIYVNNSGRYVVQGVDGNGCINTSAERVINGSLADIPEICIVGTDNSDGKNVIVWNAPVSYKIDSFIVYRESAVTNVYDKIGAVAYSGNHYFKDMNSNNAVKQYKYRITSLDSCGTETPMSISHSTMHLMVNAALNDHWNLIWRPYQGVEVLTYKIYRGADSLNMQQIAQIPGNSYSYTDLNNPSGNIFYQIEAVTNASCANYNTIKSNAFNTYYASGVGIELSVSSLSNVKIYPNLTDGILNCEIISNSTVNLSIDIYNETVVKL